jgi:iron complex transport system permease protein
MMWAKRIVWATLLGIMGLVIAFGFSLGVGSAKIGWSKAIGGLLAGVLGGDSPLKEVERAIVMEIRLPRICLTALAGTALAVCGLVLQALLGNPLAEPFILGISSGAAMGAILAIALGIAFGGWGLTALAFLGAMLTVILVMAMAGSRGRLNPTTLLLTGVIINAFFTAVIMFVLSTSREARIHQMLFWLYGNVTGARLGEVLWLAPLVLAGSAVLFLQARGMNLLVLGDETAMHLGLSLTQYRWGLLGVTSFLTAAVVSLSGIIGFVGLIVPHLCRMTHGPDHRVLVPACALWGASFLLLADGIARAIFSPVEIPLGVVTAAVGAPFFLLLLHGRGTQWMPS